MKVKIEELLNECIPGFKMPNKMDLTLTELDGWDSMASFILLDKIKDEYGIVLEIENLGKMSILELSNLIPIG
jgi:acyl carrier protein